MPKLIDFTNKRFGSVTVLGRAENRGHRTAWRCKCDCGKEFTLLGETLRKGKTQSCGCLKGLNLLNKTFNRLTVIEKTNKRTTDRNIIWKCKCVCGNICYVDSSSLISNNTKSCGCLNNEQRSITGKNNKKDLLNQQFGRLKVIEELPRRQNGNILWKCKCDCGNIIEITGTSLLHGTKSCGCLNSKGEYKIAQLLSKNNIPFQTQKTFETCKYDNGYYAYFDFYVDNKYLIEYDGIQHFEAKDEGWNTKENLIKTQLRDQFKNQWCEKNKIPLIRIPYWKLSTLKIEDLLL